MHWENFIELKRVLSLDENVSLEKELVSLLKLMGHNDFLVKRKHYFSEAYMNNFASFGTITEFTGSLSTVSEIHYIEDFLFTNAMSPRVIDAKIEGFTVHKITLNEHFVLLLLHGDGNIYALDFSALPHLVNKYSKPDNFHLPDIEFSMKQDLLNQMKTFGIRRIFAEGKAEFANMLHKRTVWKMYEGIVVIFSFRQKIPKILESLFRWI